MTFSISCVLMLPVSLKATANNLIQTYGFGPNNLSVELIKTSDQSAWIGCQIWCDQGFVDFIQAHQASDFSGTMIISTKTTGTSLANWNAALIANGMEVKPQPF